MHVIIHQWNSVMVASFTAVSVCWEDPKTFVEWKTPDLDWEASVDVPSGFWWLPWRPLDAVLLSLFCGLVHNRRHIAISNALAALKGELSASIPTGHLLHVGPPNERTRLLPVALIPVKDGLAEARVVLTGSKRCVLECFVDGYLDEKFTYCAIFTDAIDTTKWARLRERPATVPLQELLGPKETAVYVHTSDSVHYCLGAHGRDAETLMLHVSLKYLELIRSLNNLPHESEYQYIHAAFEVLFSEYFDFGESFQAP